MPDWSKPETIRVVRYAAVSSEEQADPNLPSIPTQLKIDDDEIARQGWTCVETIILEGESRWRDGLDPMCAASAKYRRLVEIIRNNQAEAVVAFAYHRLARTTHLALDLFFMARSSNVWLHNCSNPIKPGDWSTALWTAMIGGVSSEEQVKALIHGHRTGMEGRVKNYGLSNAIHFAPYGYFREGERKKMMLIPDPERWHWAKWIFQRRLEVGCKTIATELEYIHHVPPPHGKHWYSNTVREILRNPVYIGIVQAKRPIMCEDGIVRSVVVAEGKGHHEPLIDRDLWDRVQLLEQAGARQYHHQNGQMYAIAGLVKCAYCGDAMVHQGTPDTPGRLCLRCSRYTRSGGHACAECEGLAQGCNGQGNSHRAADVRAYIVQRILHAINNPAEFRAVMEEQRSQADNTKRIDELRGEMEQMERRRRHTLDLLENPDLPASDRDHFIARLKAFEERRLACEREIAALAKAENSVAQVTGALEQLRGLREAIPQMNEEELAPILRALIYRVELKRGEEPDIKWLCSHV